VKRNNLGTLLILAATWVSAPGLFPQTGAQGPDLLIEAISYLDEAKSKEAENPESAQRWYQKVIRATQQALRDPSQDPRRANILQREAEQALPRIAARLKDLDRAFASIEQFEKRRMIDSALQRLDEAHPPASQERFQKKRDDLKAVRDQAKALVAEANSIPKYQRSRRIDLYQQALRLNAEQEDARKQLVLLK
jgi:hypothetical protein